MAQGAKLWNVRWCACFLSASFKCPRSLKVTNTEHGSALYTPGHIQKQITSSKLQPTARAYGNGVVGGHEDGPCLGQCSDTSEPGDGWDSCTGC